MAVLDLAFDCGEASLSVLRFSVHEAVSTPFTVSVWARSESPAIDLAAIVGRPAGFRIVSGPAHVMGGGRVWTGICSFMEQTHAERRENKVLSTYHLRIVPGLWLLAQRCDYRIFQHVSVPDIADRILDEWGVRRAWRIDRKRYPTLEIKVQYAESDLAFLSRILEEAGIAYVFPDDPGDPSLLTLSDALHSGAARAAVPYEPSPTLAPGREFVSALRLAREVRPGALTMRDYDLRRPSFALFAEARAGGPEAHYEQYHYLPGGFLVETDAAGGTPVADAEGAARRAAGGTPVADAKGAARHDPAAGQERAARALEAARADRGGVAFTCNLLDLSPGVVFQVEGHPHPDLDRPLLVTDALLEGAPEGEWLVLGEAVFADVPYRPPLVTPRPEVLGVQSATVVGPASRGALDQEIRVDELGRVKVQFPWDRHGKNDDDSSCWLRVHEGWGGAGYGWLSLPRVGHEVLVTFLDGDPDRPVVAGRVHNMTHPVPYKLPEHRTISAWKSDSSPGSNGYNEIKLEDLKDQELFYLQAEKNHRRLVKHDEILTVGRDRDKQVTAEEIETVGGDRAQVTREERHEMTGGANRTLIEGDRRQLVRRDAAEVNQKNRLLLVERDQDQVVLGHRRERDEWDLGARVLGDRRERVGRDLSLLVHQQRFEKVGQTFARRAGKELHLVAGEEAVGEAPDITVRGPGGFLRIDASGVVISGTKVDINVSGSPGHGHGSHPKQPAEAREARSKTGVLREQEDFQGHATVAALRERFEKGEGGEADRQRELALLSLAASCDVSTPLDGTILWSGGEERAGCVAGQLATARAIAGKPSARLEMTGGASALIGTTEANDDPWEVSQPAWQVISRRLAEQASGEVNVVVAKVPLRSGAILREELRLLAANEKVTEIKIWRMQESSEGTYRDEGGATYELVPVSLAQVLAPAPVEER
ncbi:type VI secretion system tip protein TssI/VgrG [Sorangium sp. So ce429]